jgi:hypothetical protein
MRSPSVERRSAWALPALFDEGLHLGNRRRPTGREARGWGGQPDCRRLFLTSPRHPRSGPCRGDGGRPAHLGLGRRPCQVDPVAVAGEEAHILPGRCVAPGEVAGTPDRRVPCGREAWRRRNGGRLLKARHRPSKRVVALKMLPPSFGRDPETVVEFRKIEAKELGGSPVLQ